MTAKGKTPDGRKIKGIIHWVSAAHAVDAQVRVYDRLFTQANPGAAEDFLSLINPESLQTFDNAKLEPSVLEAQPEDRFQFERVGYFCFDSADHSNESVVMNRTGQLLSVSAESLVERIGSPSDRLTWISVSYTHLTLPTILLV